MVGGIKGNQKNTESSPVKKMAEIAETGVSSIGKSNLPKEKENIDKFNFSPPRQDSSGFLLNPKDGTTNLSTLSLEKYQNLHKDTTTDKINRSLGLTLSKEEQRESAKNHSLNLNKRIKDIVEGNQG